MRITGFCLAVMFGFVMAGCGDSGSGATPPVSPSASAPTPTQTSPPAATNFGRPPLLLQSGEKFTWLAPAGWTAKESPNGVDLTSTDGSILVNVALLRGGHGQMDPWTFTNVVLTQAGIRDIQQLRSQNLPSHPSTIPGLTWNIQEFEVTFTDSAGSPRHAVCTCAICSGYGGYDALFQGFSTPADSFDRDKTWLPLVAGSVNAIDPGSIAYQNDVIPAVNHPLDDSALMSAWETRRQSGDRIDQTNRETTMGYERMLSPIDGKTYDMPFELYDGTMHGYRDPADPNQILNRAQPGQ